MVEKRHRIIRHLCDRKRCNICFALTNPAIVERRTRERAARSRRLGKKDFHAVSELSAWRYSPNSTGAMAGETLTRLLTRGLSGNKRIGCAALAARFRIDAKAVNTIRTIATTPAHSRMSVGSSGTS